MYVCVCVRSCLSVCLYGDAFVSVFDGAVVVCLLYVALGVEAIFINPDVKGCGDNLTMQNNIINQKVATTSLTLTTH